MYTRIQVKDNKIERIVSASFDCFICCRFSAEGCWGTCRGSSPCSPAGPAGRQSSGGAAPPARWEGRSACPAAPATPCPPCWGPLANRRRPRPGKARWTVCWEGTGGHLESGWKKIVISCYNWKLEVTTPEKTIIRMKNFIIFRKAKMQKNNIMPTAAV